MKLSFTFVKCPEIKTFCSILGSYAHTGFHDAVYHYVVCDSCTFCTVCSMFSSLVQLHSSLGINRDIFASDESPKSCLSTRHQVVCMRAPWKHTCITQTSTSKVTAYTVGGSIVDLRRPPRRMLQQLTGDYVNIIGNHLAWNE